MHRWILALIAFAALPASSLQAAWPGQPFTEVKAYTYDHAKAATPLIVLPNGNLNPTAKGARMLNPAQEKLLLAAVSGKHPGHERARCFTPHHGFVFFDGEGKIVASLSICFTCNTYRSVPDGAAENWDLAALQKLFDDLGLK